MPAFFIIEPLNPGNIMLSRAHILTKQISELVEPVLEEIGFELVDVEYLSKHGKWVLRLFIDKNAGVTIDDCARVSGEIGDLIDVKDIIENDYVLEVSSPGLNRILKKEKDFIRAIGKKIKMRTAVPIKGRRNFTGYLRDFQKDTLYVEMDDGPVTLPWSESDKVNLVYEFKN